MSLAIALAASSLAELVSIIAVSSSINSVGGIVTAIALAIVMGLLSWIGLREAAEPILAEVVVLLRWCPPTCPRRHLIVLSRSASTLKLVVDSAPLLTATLSLATAPLQSLLYAASSMACSEALTFLSMEGYGVTPPPPPASKASILIASTIGLASPIVGLWVERRVLPCLQAVNMVLRELSGPG